MDFSNLFGKKKKADIIETNIATAEVNVQSGFNSVGQANAASGAIIAAQGGIIINREVNDHDGHETTFVSPFQNGVWHEKQHIVLPESEV